MDIQQYIDSGIIEAYVLGIASAEDVAELEALAAGNPEIAEAIQASRAILDSYAGKLAITPPDGLKEQIWSELAREQPPGKFTGSSPSRHDTMPFTRDKDTGVSAGPRLRRYRAAAAILLLLSLSGNIIFWNKAQRIDAELSAARRQRDQLAETSDHMLRQISDRNLMLRIVTDPSVKPVLLAGTNSEHRQNAMLYWDTRSGAVYLSLRNLPAPPPGKQYQLWAIIGGKPVDAGVYMPGATEPLQKMRNIPAAAMFAVTLEDSGGSASPTTDAMFVAGKV